MANGKGYALRKRSLTKKVDHKLSETGVEVKNGKHLVWKVLKLNIHSGVTLGGQIGLGKLEVCTSKWTLHHISTGEILTNG